jgi:hypothetical protein
MPVAPLGRGNTNNRERLQKITLITKITQIIVQTTFPKMKKVAVFSEDLGRRVKSLVDTNIVLADIPSIAKNQNAILGGITSPVEITGEWEQIQGVWKCKAKRLWRTANGNGYTSRAAGGIIDLYDPCSMDQPAVEIGARVFAIWRGVWEMVSGGGGGASPRIVKIEDTWGIIHSPVVAVPDQTLSPANQQVFDTLGMIKIIGHSYQDKDDNDEIIPEYIYDYATCFTLDPNEILVPGHFYRVKRAIVEILPPLKEGETNDQPDMIRFNSENPNMWYGTWDVDDQIIEEDDSTNSEAKYWLIYYVVLYPPARYGAKMLDNYYHWNDDTNDGDLQPQDDPETNTNESVLTCSFTVKDVFGDEYVLQASGESVPKG